MGMGAHNPSRLDTNVFTVLEEVLDQSSDGILFVNREGKIRYVNEMICELLCFTKNELLGTNIKEIYTNSVLPSSGDSEVKLRKSNGEVVTCFESTKTFEGAENLYCKLIKSKNTEKKEECLVGIKKMLTISGEINHLIAWERDSRTLIKKVCRSLVKLRENLEVWVGLFNKGRVEIVESTGHSREKLEYMAKNGEILCLKAITSESKKMGTIPINYLCKKCSLNGNSSIKKLVIPISHDSQLYGVLWLHSNSETFAGEELSMINELAGDLALALKSIEMEKKKNEALDKMKDNLEYFEYLADRLRNPLAIMRGFVDVKEDVGTDRTFREISKQINRMNMILDNLRRKEEETFKLRENLTK